MFVNPSMINTNVIKRKATSTGCITSVHPSVIYCFKVDGGCSGFVSEFCNMNLANIIMLESNITAADGCQVKISRSMEV